MTGAGRALRSWVLAAPLLAALLLAAPPAMTQAAADSLRLEALTREVAAQLRCPVCQGNSIGDSPSELAQEMKSVVRDQLASGKSPEEVKGYFVAKYGEWVLLEPKASGFNLVVYLLPLLGVLAGGFVIWRAVRKWTAPPGTAGGTA